jgi:proline iminopeptidase
MKKYTYLLCLALITLFAVPAAARADEGYIVTPDKVRIFYKIEGRGTDTLVMVHGGPGNTLESIRPDMEPLAKGRRVIYYDQRGQGRSDVVTDGTKLGYEQHVADLEALRQHFKLEKMTLMGNSWGGLLVSLYAVAHPDRVERMILDSPAAPIRGFLDDMEDEISRRMEKIYTKDEIAKLKPMARPETWFAAKDMLAHCRRFYGAVLRTYTFGQRLDNIPFKGDVCAGPMETLRLQRTVNVHAWKSLGDYNLMSQLGVVKAPVLVIHGAADVIPLRSSEFWAYGYPNARLFVIEKVGHIAQAEAPEIFFPAIETFLKGTFPAESKKIDRTPGH